MCVIERKTYFHTNGHEETIETTKPCRRAVGNRLCKHVERRSFEAARIEERKPSQSTTPSNDESAAYIVTEGSRGQQRMYRDLSKRSSNSSSVRRSVTMSDRTTPVSTPSSASSPAHVEVKPEAPSPPPAAPGSTFGERTRTPYSSAKQTPSFTKGGTAIYDRPPSLDQPRALDNERSRADKLEKESSFSSTTAQVDDAETEPTLPQPRHKKGVSIDTTERPTTSSSTASARVSSPGLSQLKSALRRDSGKDINREPSSSSSSRRHRSDSDRHRRKADDHEGPIDRERRQSSRERRDRHRREAAEALEGRNERAQRGRDAERAAMERERERAAFLRRGDEVTKAYYDDQLRRDGARYYDVHPRGGGGGGAAYSPITSARAFGGSGSAGTSMQPMPPSGTLQPRVHQYGPPAESRGQGQSIADRGADVIAREQARAAGQRMQEAVGGAGREKEREKEREAEAYQRWMDERYGGGGGGGGRWR